MGRGASRTAVARGAGGSGPLLAAVGAVLAVIVVAVLIFAGRGKGKPAPPPPTTTPAMTTRPPAAEPVRQLPPPTVPESLLAEGRAQHDAIASTVEQGRAIYEEAMRAHQAGDMDLFQEKLTEASGVLREVNDLWNEIADQMPDNKDWDRDMVAAHYLPKEMKLVNQAGKLLKEINQQRTLSR